MGICHSTGATPKLAMPDARTEEDAATAPTPDVSAPSSGVRQLQAQAVHDFDVEAQRVAFDLHGADVYAVA